MLATVLADEGYEVDVACNGRLALEKIEAQDYDLIFSDLRMPELDGVGLYRELERWQPDLLRRLVIITGTSAHPEYESFLTETHVPFLEKPSAWLRWRRSRARSCRPRNPPSNTHEARADVTIWKGTPPITFWRPRR